MRRIDGIILSKEGFSSKGNEILVSSTTALLALEVLILFFY